MKFKCISCDALARQTYLCAAQSPHLIDVELVSMGQHIKPEELNRTLQSKIDSVNDTGYDAILLCYGLCGQATSGLVIREIPVVMPRAHDCITLCLGSKEEYKKQQETCPGTIWYTKDYMERLDNATEFTGMGASSTEFYDEKAYEAMVGRMGKERADRIINSMGEMTKNYERVVFIDQDTGDSKKEEKLVRKEAEIKGWRFEKMKGDMRLIKGLLDGGWPEENAFRMDHYPYKDEIYIKIFEDDKEMIESIHETFKEEIKRKKENNETVIIEKVFIRGPNNDLTFENVEVTPHNIRNDMFQPDVITALDVIMSLGDQDKLKYDVKWYESIGTAKIVKNYYVEKINEDVAHGRRGFVYENGDYR